MAEDSNTPDDSTKEKGVGAAEIGFGAAAGVGVAGGIAASQAKTVMKARAMNIATETVTDLAKNPAVFDAVGKLATTGKGVFEGQIAGKHIQQHIERNLKDLAKDTEALQSLSKAGKKYLAFAKDVATIKTNPLLSPYVSFKNMKASGIITVGAIGTVAGLGAGYAIHQLRNLPSHAPKVNVAVNITAQSHADKLANEPSAGAELGK